MVTLYFQLPGDDRFKDPMHLADTAGASIPQIGDVIRDNAGTPHKVVGRIFDWDGDEGLSITLECVRCSQDVQ